MARKADITIKYPNLTGYDPKDRNRPVIVENAGGRKSTKTFNFLSAYSKHMHQGQFGAGFAQHWIELDRVPGFLADAYSHGLKVEWVA